jgi:hypothetical protein
MIIVIVAILLSFIGFNLSNTCDISLGFKTFPNVPVYLTIFGSFLLGMICSLPFIIFGSLKKDKQPDEYRSPNIPESPANSSRMKGLFRKKQGDSDAGKTDDIGPYGID